MGSRVIVIEDLGRLLGDPDEQMSLVLRFVRRGDSVDLRPLGIVVAPGDENDLAVRLQLIFGLARNKSR